MLLLFACTSTPEPIESASPVDTEVESPWASPHRVILLDVGGRLEWDGEAWSLRSRGASTGILYTEAPALDEEGACRLVGREDPLSPGVTPIRLSSSIERIAGHWNGEAYDMLNFEGQQVYEDDGDSLRAYNEEEGLDVAIDAPSALDAWFGPFEGWDTEVLAGTPWMWVGVWSGDVALMCMVNEPAALLPQEGQALLGDRRPDAVKVVFANAQVVEGFFDEPAWLIAGRGYDLPTSLF